MAMKYVLRAFGFDFGTSEEFEIKCKYGACCDLSVRIKYLLRQ